ncbi:ParB/RepB/Spo0J family partition protein [Cucumibacter marinus]|uniref:ParB/RepB/Spo0J family partition protein n=1 Tax=Cucumibacter marinus TaxID=1121252 RepID=UPI0003F99C80|nr:ParB/RepB/Spo0J family partition protein [Cucumibacter marinus]
MNEKKTNQRLGRGLAALIGDVAPAEAPRVADRSGVKRLPVEFIVPNPNNPRRDFDAENLDELTESIREKGVMQPLLVRPGRQDPDRFELIAGERRWRASQRAGLHEVPVIIRDVDDREALELAIIENVQRADLNPLEEAQGYQQLVDQFSYSQNELAQVIGKSRSHVANTLRLMKLPEKVRDYVARGELTAGHARTLITADDPEALAKRIVDGGLSVREAEVLQQKMSAQKKTGESGRAAETKSADTLALEKTLSDTTGLKVSIDHKERGGKVEIKYRTLEQLDAICRLLQGS